jgi:hypothetical protein
MHLATLVMVNNFCLILLNMPSLSRSLDKGTYLLIFPTAYTKGDKSRGDKGPAHQLHENIIKELDAKDPGDNQSQSFADIRQENQLIGHHGALNGHEVPHYGFFKLMVFRVALSGNIHLQMTSYN